MGLGKMTGPLMDDRSIERLGMLSSRKVEEFSFAVLHNEASIKEDFGYNVVATKKKGGR